MDEMHPVEQGDADVFQIMTPQGMVPVAVDTEGLIYLSGDLHPMGALVAMVSAIAEDIPFIEISAVEALYPTNWLVAASMSSADAKRLAIITQIERLIRGGHAARH